MVNGVPREVPRPKTLGACGPSGFGLWISLGTPFTMMPPRLFHTLLFHSKAYKARCTVCCIQCTAFCVECTAFCIQCTSLCIQCTVCCIQCTAFCVQCTAFCIQCTSLCIQCTSFCIQCTVCTFGPAPARISPSRLVCSRDT